VSEELVEAEAVYEGEVLMNGVNALKEQFWECAYAYFGDWRCKCNV